MGGDFTLVHGLTLHGLVTVVALLCYAVTTHVRQQRRSPSVAIAWVLFLLLLPYLALPLFLVFGTRKLVRPRSTGLVRAAVADAERDWAVATALALGQGPPATFRALQVHADGAAARAVLFDVIAGARQSIDVSTFVFADDALGDAVLERLCTQARAGVRVRLLIDGVGRWLKPRPTLERLAAAGGQYAYFVPPLHRPRHGHANLRNHRKAVLADAGTTSARLWAGGRNLAAEYFGEWNDLTFDLQGPVVSALQALFDQDWAFATTGKARGSTPAATGAIAQGGAQLIASGPDQSDDAFHVLLLMAAYRARTRLLLATPYFVPDSALALALGLAARRGVSVELLLPARSNHRLSDIARGRALRALAQAGGRVLLSPSMLHAKLVIVDETLAFSGSANLDSRSFFVNYEQMLAFHEAEAVQAFAAWYAQARVSATPFTPVRPGFLQDLGEGLLLWVAYQL